MLPALTAAALSLASGRAGTIAIVFLRNRTYCLRVSGHTSASCQREDERGAWPSPTDKAAGLDSASGRHAGHWVCEQRAPALISGSNDILR